MYKNGIFEEKEGKRGGDCIVEVNVKDDQREVEVWLTKAEKEDAALQERLKKLYQTYKEKKYLVVVYQSGREDVFQSTLALLQYNKKKMAEREVQRERVKKKKHAEMER